MTRKAPQFGITGGIGSGKTTVCRIFEMLGIPVYYADERAKYLMNHDPELREAIREEFGPQAYLDGEINRAFLADLIFREPERRKELEGLVHPRVWMDGEAWQARYADAPYTLKEAALLVESGGYRLLNGMIFVEAPEEVRIRRAMERDGSSRESVLSRIRAQMPDEEKRILCRWTIVNDGNHLLIPQVLNVHRSILETEILEN